MVRTRAENTGRRVVGAKAPRKQLAASSSSSSAVSGSPGSKDKHCGGNPVRWAATPSWQKGIGTFFGIPEATDEEPTPEEHSTTTGIEEHSTATGIEDLPSGDNSTTNHSASNAEQRSSNIDQITSLAD